MQNLTIQLKRLGKKKIHRIPMGLEAPVHTLSDLIVACVQSEVKRFNEKRDDPSILPFLTAKDIQEQSTTGKIAFGDIENKEKAAVDASIEVAMQGFKDGLFLVFVDDNEVKALDESLDLNPDSNITFMRMTFLTGTFW